MKKIFFILGIVLFSACVNAKSTNLHLNKPMIKSGTVLFAVLDTAVNSDNLNSLVGATIAEGKYKGAKLNGKLTTIKNESEQLNRFNLNFTAMKINGWPKTINIIAYAIDPDTARTVLASKVDYNYLQRYKTILAASFLQSYTKIFKAASPNTDTLSTLNIKSGSRVGILFISERS